jgi:hypothetical protein
MEYEVHRRDGRATPTAVRELLDEAVRRMAVSADELWERLAAASMTLGRLSRDDLPTASDRRLLDSIRLRVMQLDLAHHDVLDFSGPAVKSSDGALEAIAEDILRLRDRAVLRAFTDPPVAS